MIKSGKLEVINGNLFTKYPINLFYFSRLCTQCNSLSILREHSDSPDTYTCTHTYII